MYSVRPKSLKEVLLCSRDAFSMPLSQSGTASETEDMAVDALQNEMDSRLPDPPSPSKSHHAGDEMDTL